MQDLDDGVRAEHGRFSAASREAGGKVRPFVEEASIVPAHRLLEVATALSDGASEMHALLRHLEPAERDAILDQMAGQLSSIVNLWVDLVRGVVPGSLRPVPSEDTETGEESAEVSPDEVDESSAPSLEGAGPLTGTWSRRRDEATAAAADPEPSAGVRLLPRRQTSTTSAPEPWGATALRTVKVDEPESAYEGDRLTRDELTGVLNRQAGFAALGRELDRCRRAGERFVLGYLNVDGLKTVNSAEGPRGGDELLRKVTAALRATLRSYDVIMRLGGDEFLFSLPGADMATAELRAHEFGIILNEEAPGASASVGYSELRGNDTLDEIISRAEIELVKSRRSRVRTR
jgi:diguanylate cyclase (GGDEF)-like protein